MKQTLDEITYFNGNSISKTFFNTTLMIFVFICLFGVGGTLFMNYDSTSYVHVLIGIMPYLILGFTVPMQVYNMEYFQKAKYYMVPINKAYRYHMKEVYSIANIVLFVGLSLLLDVTAFYFFEYKLFSMFFEIVFGFCISPVFVSLGFCIRTYFGKKTLWIRIVFFIFTHIGTAVYIISYMLIKSYWFIGFVILSTTLSLLIVDKLMIRKERKLEV